MRDNSLEAMRWASADARDNENWYRLCLKYVRSAWALPAVYGTAKAACLRSKRFHPWTKGQGTKSIPFGAPIYTRPRNAPAHDPWHVVLAGGWARDGQRIVWSTDILVKGEPDAVRLVDLLRKWDHVVIGWASDLNGYVLPLPKAPSER